jgi:ribonuclease HII
MRFTIGVDEAGRGPWAGPVFVGLVVLNEEQEKFLVEKGITDSKKLTEKKRDALYPVILENCVYSKVKLLSAVDIDKVGIYEATKLLIKELAKETGLLELNIDDEDKVILIDGVFPELELLNSKGEVWKHECIIKGDATVPAISAASILAKVRRDAYMLKLCEKFPQYQFDKHKGYGTKLHMEMLELHGACEEHRRSFKPLKKYI